ncbi:MAG TPA: GNAT family N-acetyltransferase [Kofleriaceae bacterium]
MTLRSIGLTTELALIAIAGEVVDRGDYLVGRVPDQASWYDGNLLVFPAAPQVGEVAYWTRKFTAELGSDPNIHHVTLAWDGIRGDVGAREELVAQGFTLDIRQVMTARSLTALPVAAGIDVRPLYAREVPDAGDLAFTVSDDHSDGLRQFLDRRAQWQQAMVASGVAMWWGAFANKQLVGSLGLVALGDRARFQDVQTLAPFRKRGIAGAMLAAAANAVLPTVKELVIVCEPDSAASRVYERVGFTAIERVVQARRRPV